MKLVNCASETRAAGCRSPLGERGLKQDSDLPALFEHVSLSPRRAWIETYFAFEYIDEVKRRSPLGERGLKHKLTVDEDTDDGRSPLGERGLKP